MKKTKMKPRIFVKCLAAFYYLSEYNLAVKFSTVTCFSGLSVQDENWGNWGQVQRAEYAAGTPIVLLLLRFRVNWKLNVWHLSY